MSEPKFTKGPWVWEVNNKSKIVELCGCGIEVLRFKRWGMQGAAPTFTKKDGLFKLQGEKVSDLSVDIKGREQHSEWCQTIDHPDAHLISSAPEMYIQLSKLRVAINNLVELDLIRGEYANEALDLVAETHELQSKARGEG